jgi:hypothetical protein
MGDVKRRHLALFRGATLEGLAAQTKRVDHVQPVVGNPLAGVRVVGLGPGVGDAIARDLDPTETDQEPKNLVEPSGRDIFNGWPSLRP